MVSQRQRLIFFSNAHCTLFLGVFYVIYLFNYACTVHVLLYGISDGINNFIINQATQEYVMRRTDLTCWIICHESFNNCHNYSSHNLCSGFHYETYIGISLYRTLAVVWIEMYGSYVMCDLIVWENTNVVHFSCDMGKYSTCSMNKVFA